jgi:hypothetical protein
VCEIRSRGGRSRKRRSSAEKKKRKKEKKKIKDKRRKRRRKTKDSRIKRSKGDAKKELSAKVPRKIYRVNGRDVRPNLVIRR